MALGLRFSTALLSDTGRSRANNEDAVVEDLALGLLVLADGMGGYNAGEVASRLAATTVRDAMRRHWPDIRPGEIESGSGLSSQTRLLRDAIVAAHAAVREAAANEPAYAGMGTTIVCCLLCGDRASIAHVGDSRLYRLRDGQLGQLTRDHSLMEELIARGAYAREDAPRFVRRNIVTRALGVEPGMEVDLIEETLQAGDLLLLCSDGLTDMVDDQTIALTLAREPDTLAGLASELVRIANERGGRDNISVALARVEQTPPTTERWTRRVGRWLHGSRP